ncbi:MAG: spore maturation protein [Oscillospiraceae bacterium]|nr:spore maturation protein [Oscillospiraceae bacterium]
MNTLTSLTVPVTLLLIGGYGVYKKTDVYDALIHGAGDGIKLLFRILPSITALFCAIYMLRASGALDIICSIMSPITSFFGIPEECSPLLLLRPLSGSAALAFGSDIIKTCGVNSLAGRTAAVMLGASETTFYTISVYFGAIGLNRTRHAIPAALCADVAGFIASAIAVRLFF